MKQSLKTLITAVLAFALSCTVLFWLNPLTPQVNADMYRYVEQKQAEINRTWSK